MRRNELRWWACPEEHGAAINFTILRKRGGTERFRAFWTATRDTGRPGTVSCPSCTRPMSVVQQVVGADAIELDVCRGCQMVWFDNGEDTAVAGPLEEEANPLAHLQPDAQLELKKAEARLMMASRQHHTGYADAPGADTEWNRLLSVFGMPVEDGEPVRRVLPLVSGVLTLGMVVFGVVALLMGDALYERWGFLAEEPLRGAGVPALGGLWLDPRPFSVALNVGVMWRLGDNVEDVLGHPGFIALVTTASVLGWVLHCTGLHPAGEPMFGLTSATAAIAVFYAMRFPDVRLAWYLLRESRWSSQGSGWVMAPARQAVAWWMLAALSAPWIGAESALPGSGAEALVGAGVGWLAWRFFGTGVLRHPDEQ